MEQDSYVITGKRFVAFFAHAPIPTHCLKPGELGLMTSDRALRKFLKEANGGSGREIFCVDEAEAQRVLDTLIVPKGTIYLKSITKKGLEGCPDKVLMRKAGIVA